MTDIITAEDHLRNLLLNVKRILPDHCEMIQESDENGANDEWFFYACKHLADITKAVEEAEKFLHD